MMKLILKAKFKPVKSDSAYDKKELAMGVKVEMEHTDDKVLAKKIAKHHLNEIPDYYTRLLAMEKEAMGKEKKDKSPKMSDVKKFFKKYPNPPDEGKGSLHEYADRHGFDKHKFEELAYKIATKHTKE